MLKSSRVHHFVIVPLSCDSAVVHRPKVTQVFHGVGARYGRSVRVCRDTQVFTVQVFHAFQGASPGLVHRIEGPGSLALL